MAKTFVERALAGEAVDFGAFYAEIDAWHVSPDPTPPLHEYLGMSRDEYRRACQGSAELLGVIADRKATR